MFNQFRSNNNERGDEEPRFIFTNLRRQSRPILVYEGYKQFTGTTLLVWLFFVIIIWVFQIEIIVSKDTMSSLASSSVELAGLSLALLAILHELNDKDKWFKVGLSLVALLFVLVVLFGFFSTLIWTPNFETPQSITVIVVGILATFGVLNIDWNISAYFLRVKGLQIIRLSQKLSLRIGQIKPYILFLLPLFLSWPSVLNLVTFSVLLFYGATFSLIILLLVTTFRLLTQKQEVIVDPFLETLKTRYENEIQTLIRFGEVKIRILDVLEVLQEESQKAAMDAPKSREPQMIDRSDVVSRLRRIGIKDEQNHIFEALGSLVNERKVSRQEYSGPYWLVPTDELIESRVPFVYELALIATTKNLDRGRDTSYYLESYRFEALRNWLAKKANMPSYVIGEYVMPKVLEKLSDPDRFAIVEKDNDIIFVNRGWGIRDRGFWIGYLKNSLHGAKDVRKNFLSRLPHTDDSSYNYYGPFRNIEGETLEKILKTLHISIENLA